MKKEVVWCAIATLVLPVLLGLLLLRGCIIDSAAQRNAARIAEKQKEAEARISKMSPSELLAAFKSNTNEAYRKQLLAAIPSGTPEWDEAMRIRARENAAREEAKSRVEEAAFRAEIQARKAFAPLAEQILLSQASLDTTCTTEGHWDTTLRVKSRLMSRVLAYKLANDGGIYAAAKKYGFKRLVFESTFDGEEWDYE